MAFQTASDDRDLELRVQRGPQAGARSPLPPMDETRGWELHIGDAPAHAAGQRRGGRRRHDVALFGATPARLRATPGGDGRHIRLELLEGFASIDGRPLPAATPVPWPMYSNLQVADVALAFGSAVEPRWNAERDDHEGRDHAADEGPAPLNGDAHASASTDAGEGTTAAAGAAAAAPSDHADPAAHHAQHHTRHETQPQADAAAAISPATSSRQNWPRHLVIAGVSLLAASLLLFAFVKMTGWGGKPHNLVLIEQALATKGFTQLKLQIDAAGVPVISGTLPSAADQRALEALLQRLDATAKLDIQLPNLSDLVKQFFTRIGVPDARIENLGGGRIVARTRSATLATATQIDEAIADARRDIAGLEQLTIHNELPAPASVAAESSCGRTPSDPGKRPSSVVHDGKDSTLNTADGTRYRINSTLPSGHVLRSIDKDKTVTVECDGRFTSFRL